MTSKKIDALSDADLNFLEKLLSKEFSNNVSTLHNSSQKISMYPR